MARFGHTAVSMGHATTNNIKDVIQEQWRQEWHNNGIISERTGDIFIRRGIITESQRMAILQKMAEDKAMEPNISWDKDAIFNRNLNVHKAEKQLLGEYVGKVAATSFSNTTIFLAGSTTVYYVFRGLVKSGAKVKVRTVNAAILSAYPSVESQIEEVSVIWDGNVDLDNAIIVPYFSMAEEILPKAIKGITHAIVSCVGFDSVCGPIIENQTARVITECLLKSNESYECWFVIDHSKITNNWRGGTGFLLFPQKKDWDKIRSKKMMKIIIDVHPQMPSELAREPVMRDIVKIERMLKSKNISQREIDEVKQYEIWRRQTTDLAVKEVLHTHQ